MTRILSVFNLLKRVGFALLLLGLFKSGYSDWGNEVVLWQNQEGVGSAGGTADVAIDSEGRAHITFHGNFWITEDDPFLHEGWYYSCIDTLGTQVVPTTLLTDSLFRDAFNVRVLLFEPDSIWLMAMTVDSSDIAAFRYAALDWQGNLMRPVGVFTSCNGDYASQWLLLSTPDRTIVMTVVSPGWDDLRVIVQEADGARPIDCEIAFDQRPCDGPTGFVNDSDTLQLVWRQFPSWNAIYTKRIGIRDPIPPNSIDDFIALTPASPGYGRAPGFAISLSDTQMLLQEGHFDIEEGIYLRIVDLRTYETVRSIQTGLFAGPHNNFGVFADTMITIVVKASGWFGVKIRGFYLDDFSVAFESDSLWVTDQNGGRFTARAYAASPFGHHHVVYTVPPVGSAGGTGQTGYQMWKTGPFTTVRERAAVMNFDLSVFPNPFNSTLRILLDAPLHSEVNVFLYDLLGREVDVVFRGRLSGNTISYAAPAGMSSGVYFLRAESRGVSVMRKVVLLK